MGPSSTDGNLDASDADLLSTDPGSEAAKSPVARSRFLRAMNYFPEEDSVPEISELPRSGPAPVVVIREEDEDLADGGVGWRQRLMAMDGIELPEFEDLDSLPAAPQCAGDDGVVLSPWDATWDDGGGNQDIGELPALNDPRQLWLNTEESRGVPSEQEAETESEKLPMSESDEIMSTEGLTPSLETAAIPPVQETKLWTGLGQPAKKSVDPSEAESPVVADDKDWSGQSADVAFVAAVLEDVPPPVEEPEAAEALEEEEEGTPAAGARGAGVKLAPGWKPLRGSLDAEAKSGGGDDDNGFEESAGDEPSCLDADPEKRCHLEAEAEAEVRNETGESGGDEAKQKGGAEERSVVRAPRHDSIVEGFGNFLNDSVVLDAAFMEPDFKALQSDEVDSQIGAMPEAELELDAESLDEIEVPEETGIEGRSEYLPVDSDQVPDTAEPFDEPGDSKEWKEKAESDSARDAGIGQESDPSEIASEGLDDGPDEPGPLSLEVVAPDELDSSEVIPAAIVVPALIDGEDDEVMEPSELGKAGLSLLGLGDGREEGTPLLDKLTAEVSGDRESNQEDASLDQFGALEEPEKPQSSSRLDGGFTSGNAALVRHGVSCPACHQTLRIQNRYLGIEGRCPGCAEMIVAKCMASGLVIAELAETERPKFFQQPDIEPEDVWGGTRLAPGGGPATAAEVDPGKGDLTGDQGDCREEIGAGKDVSAAEEEDDLNTENAAADTEQTEGSEGESPAAPDPIVDPFSHPGRAATDSSEGADAIWGPGIGRPLS